MASCPQGGLGATWKIRPDLSVAGAFFLALMDEVTSTGTATLPGIYDTRVYIISLGVAWRYDLVAAR